MISHNTPQQFPTHPYRPSLGEAASWLVEQRTKEELFTRHWVCMGCGTTHARMLPEECESCGATALEFEYAAAQISH